VYGDQHGVLHGSPDKCLEYVVCEYARINPSLRDVWLDLLDTFPDLARIEDVLRSQAYVDLTLLALIAERAERADSPERRLSWLKRLGSVSLSNPETAQHLSSLAVGIFRRLILTPEEIRAIAPVMRPVIEGDLELQLRLMSSLMDGASDVQMITMLDLLAESKNQRFREVCLGLLGDHRTSSAVRRAAFAAYHRIWRAAPRPSMSPSDAIRIRDFVLIPGVEPELQHAAASLLLELGDRSSALEWLAKSIDSDVVEERWGAVAFARDLFRYDEAMSKASLERLLNDPQPRVYFAAYLAMARSFQEDPAVARTLLETYEKETNPIARKLMKRPLVERGLLSE
jgi:hypothetical protein